MQMNIAEESIRPDIPSYVSITPWTTFDSQMDNGRFLVAAKRVVPGNQCQGVSYLNLVKWTGYKFGITDFDNWNEKDYYDALSKFVKTKNQVTEYQFHNALYYDLFKGKAKIVPKPFSLGNIKNHIFKEKAPVIFSIDVREAFNPNSKEEMGHVIMAVGKSDNGVAAHDPRGNFFSKYKDLDGNCSFFPNETLERIARKNVGIYCPTLL